MTLTEICLIAGLIITILGFIGSLVNLWVKIKIKLTEMETGNDLKISGMIEMNKTQLEKVKSEMNIRMEAVKKEFELQLKAIDSKTVGLSEFLGRRVTEFVADNKEDHNEIKNHVGQIFEPGNAYGENNDEERQHQDIIIKVSPAI